MKRIVIVSVIVSTLVTSAMAHEQERDRTHSVKKSIASVPEITQKELDAVDGFGHMFQDGKVTGQIRSSYSEIHYKSAQDVYATAVGGFLKYELAEYKGLSAGVEFVTSQNVNALSGKGVKYNAEFSSQAKEYTQMSEAYINYNYKGFKLRAGRQTIDTPLADSDDIRMVADSFNAYILTYEQNELSFMGGYLDSWQGYDAGLDTPWVATGKDGTYLAGISWNYASLDASLWYYNINGQKGDTTANNSYYSDIVGHFHLSEELFWHIGGQYLLQKELDNSGVASEIYGAMSELVSYGFGVNIAYDKSLKKQGKQSFSGFGGGTLFTSMDNMIVDNIAVDRDVEAFVGGVSYDYESFNLLYGYGDFYGSANSLGQTEHIVEQNIGFAYEKEDSLTFGAIFTKQDDKKQTGINSGDWRNFRVLVAYNF